jgi:hypothetical protein
VIYMIFLAALLVAILLTAAFARAYRRRRPWTELWIFFLIVFLFALVGGIWTAPYGPVYWNVPWFGVVFWAVVVALLLAALVPPGARRDPRRSSSQVDRDRLDSAEDSAAALGFLFWMLIGLLLAAIVWGLLR